MIQQTKNADHRIMDNTLGVVFAVVKILGLGDF
jgi:hypothetical protein